jgi:DNA-binding Lrp family transcriptional regulator
MDDLDIRIYRALLHGETGPPFESEIRRSYRSVARRLGIDEVTANNRIKRFWKMGFLRGWQLVVNPELLGVSWTQTWFDVVPPAAKSEVISRVSSMDGVLTLSNYLGPGLTAIVMTRDGGDSHSSSSWSREKRSNVETISAVSGTNRIRIGDIRFPRPSVRPSPLDWRIIEAIQTNPRESYDAISRALRASSKTIKRRLGSLIDSQAVFVLPSFDPSALTGAMMADLVIFYSSRKSKAALDSEVVTRFDRILMRAELSDQRHGFFNLVVRNSSELGLLLNWVEEARPRLEDAFVELVVDRIEIYGSLGKVLDGMLARNTDGGWAAGGAVDRASRSTG